MSHSSTFSLVSAGPVGVSMRDEGLDRHINECARANAWHTVRCTAESVDSFLSARFVSTIVAAAALLALSAYW